MRNRYLLVLALGFLISHAALAQPSRRVQLAFSGTTSASQLLIEDVMKNVMEVGAEEFDCAAPDTVTAEVLPEGFQPALPRPAPEGARRTVHEHWQISFCGREVPFLLTFWTLEQGGTAFELDYPSVDRLAAAGETGAQFR